METGRATGTAATDPRLAEPPSIRPLSYPAREPGIRPEAHDLELDAGLAPLREQGLTAAGFGEAA